MYFSNSVILFLLVFITFISCNVLHCPMSPPLSQENYDLFLKPRGIEEAVVNGWENQTLRQYFKPQVDLSNLRIRVSNIYSRENPVIIEKIVFYLSNYDNGSVNLSTSKVLTFNNHEQVKIPPGGYQISDIIDNIEYKHSTHFLYLIYILRHQVDHPVPYV